MKKHYTKNYFRQMHSVSKVLLQTAMALLLLTVAQGQINFTGTAYTQNFDGLASSPATGNTFTNGSAPLAGWFLFRQPAPGTAITTYNANNGSNTAGSFYSYGTTDERAFGGLGSGGAYFGSPAAGAIAGWMAVGLTNNSGSTINTATIGFNGEQWRNGGNSTAQTMVLEYGFGTSFTDVTSWTAPGGAYDWASPVATTTAGAVDGNVAGRVNSLGGTLTSLSWAPAATLWIRWVERNDAGNDHGLAIDDFSFSAVVTGGGLPVVTIAAQDANAAEEAGDPGTFRITRSGSTAEALVVSYTISGTASTADYTPTLTGTATIAIGQSFTDITIIPVDDADVEGSETVIITLSDEAAYDVTATISATVTIADNDFGITKIHTIQGSGSTAPIVNQIAVIEGIVTRVFAGTSKLNGFYVQEEDADADTDPATSEALFIFDPSGLFSGATGDKVRVKGTITEFTSQGSSLTQLSTVTSIINLGVSTLPTVINVQLPVSNVSDLERYEGMLVNVSATNGNLTVTDNFQLGRFGQIILAANGTSNQTGTDARLDQFTQFNSPSVSGYGAYQADIAKRRILLDDGSSTQNVDPILFGRGGNPLSASNTLRSGDAVSSITGILDHRFEGYRIQTTTAVNFTAANPRPATPPVVGGTLKVAGFNVLNYFNGDGLGGGFPTSRGADNGAEFTRQRDKIFQAIIGSGADVIGLMEIENDGFGPNSAIQNMVSGLNSIAGAGTFTFITPVTSLGNDEIAVGLIYKPARVTPYGNAAAMPNGFGTGSLSQFGRIPLAQTFEENATGQLFTVVVNHFKSKGSSSGGVGDADAGDGQGLSNGTRTRQAQDLAAWLATQPTGTTDKDYLVIGDLNAYAMEDPLTSLAASGYQNLLPVTSYSYVFDGQVGSLDHALATSFLSAQVTGADKWHINADEPNVLDYNTNFKTPGQVTTLYNADAFRSSDHDPILIGLQLNEMMTWYRDNDHDGWGRTNNPIVSATQPRGYVSRVGDCNDGDASIYPTAQEMCDGKDNNCNGQVDEGLPGTKLWYRDDDGDGWGRTNRPKQSCVQPRGFVDKVGDCNDYEASINPDAQELCDGKDNNCNGVVDEGLPETKLWYRDDDGDGWGRTNSPIQSCVQPRGYVDKPGDCNNDNANIYPGAHEYCDGKDNDCDGVKDDNCGPLITSTKQILTGKPVATADETVLEATIWPNPARTELMVTLDAFVPNQKLSITMMQADGKVQQSQNLTPAVKGQQVRLDVSSAVGGFYLLQIKQNGLSVTKRFIVIR